MPKPPISTSTIASYPLFILAVMRRVIMKVLILPTSKAHTEIATVSTTTRMKTKRMTRTTPTTRMTRTAAARKQPRKSSANPPRSPSTVSATPSKS